MSSLGATPRVTESQTPALKARFIWARRVLACDSRLQRLVFNGNQVPRAVPQAVLTEAGGAR